MSCDRLSTELTLNPPTTQVGKTIVSKNISLKFRDIIVRITHCFEHCH